MKSLTTREGGLPGEHLREERIGTISLLLLLLPPKIAGEGLLHSLLLLRMGQSWLLSSNGAYASAKAPLHRSGKIQILT